MLFSGQYLEQNGDGEQLILIYALFVVEYEQHVVAAATQQRVQ